MARNSAAGARVLDPATLSRLSVDDRLELIEQLWGSLEEESVPLTSQQQAELERRLANIDDEEAGSVTWEQLKAELAARCR